MTQFYSKRNQVRTMTWQDCPAVEKRFATAEDWAREASFYRVLDRHLPHPALLHASPGLLVTEYCPYPTLLDELEAQERTEFSPTPWQALALWLHQCHRLTGQLPADGNLRNFLWDSLHRQIIGLDFEEYRPMSLTPCAAVLIAFLLTYAPADTPVKQRAAALLMQELQVETSASHAAREALLWRRRHRHGLNAAD